MQNHMPYNLNPDQTQLDYYMDGIKNTDVRMGELMEELKKFGSKPTVVMMVGDHFPFFTEENSAYDLLGHQCAKLSGAVRESVLHLEQL